MNLVLTHCGKEWRSQRALLVAYSLLTFACISLGLLLLPKSWWLDDGQRAFALSCFVAAGVIGVLAFAAPALVKNEFGAKGDQFVRRLPGALVPSFGGKLLFLVLVAAALPLVALLWGELFLQAIGQPWDDLFRWYRDGSVALVWAWPALFCGYALLLAPWVWAVGAWLPGGRMAVGGVVLLVLLLGMGVVAVLRQHPNLELGIAWQRWLWAVAPLGVVVAGFAWTQGRRGGGPLRSARIGATAMLIGLVPPSAWLGAEAWRYRHPDPQALVTLDVHGMTPDLRFALVLGNEHDEWQPATFRIDLTTGGAVQVAGLDSVLLPAAWAANVNRWWIDHSRVDLAQGWFDLATGERTPLAVDARGRLILSAEQLRCVAAETRASTRFRAPGDRRLWIDGADVCMESVAGEVERFAAPEPVVGARAAGHGLIVSSPKGSRLFVPTRHTFRELPPNGMHQGVLVGDVLLNQVRPWRWQRQRLGEAAAASPVLDGARLVGLVDDDRVLFGTVEHGGRRLLLYRPADDTVQVLATSTTRWYETTTCLEPMGTQGGSLLPRDPTGRVWLAVIGLTEVGARHLERLILRLDVATGRLDEQPLLRLPSDGELLAFGEGTILFRTGAKIERIDLDTGARTVLFPRQRPAH